MNCCSPSVYGFFGSPSYILNPIQIITNPNKKTIIPMAECSDGNDKVPLATDIPVIPNENMLPKTTTKIPTITNGLFISSSPPFFNGGRLRARAPAAASTNFLASGSIRKHLHTSRSGAAWRGEAWQGKAWDNGDEMTGKGTTGKEEASIYQGRSRQDIYTGLTILPSGTIVCKSLEISIAHLGLAASQMGVGV